jgi:hypothetical protein
MSGLGLDSSGSEQCAVAGSCNHGDETSGPINGGKLLDQLRDHDQKSPHITRGSAHDTKKYPPPHTERTPK